VKKPSIGALLLALIPYVGMCFSVALWDRLDPHILGLPFNLFWIVCWLLVTPLIMTAIYRLERRR
jgi:hypothetical protein